MTISHHDHQPSYLSAFIPFIHDANLPSVIMTISHHTYQPSCNSSMMPICHQTPPLPRLCHYAYQPSCQSATPPLPLKNHAHLPSYLKAIMPISHLAPPFSQYANNPSSASQKLCPSAIIPKSHYANQPPCSPPLQPIKQISHHDPPSPLPHHIHWPSCQSATVPLPLFHYSNQLSRAFNITNHLPS